MDTSWETVRWCCIGDDVKRADAIFTLGVPRLLKSGPRKGQKTWRDSERREIVVTDEEAAAEFARCEAGGVCGDCIGTKQVRHGWSKDLGNRFIPCVRCESTGVSPGVQK